MDVKPAQGGGLNTALKPLFFSHPYVNLLLKDFIIATKKSMIVVSTSQCEVAKIQ